MKDPLIVIVGPTASGKSDLAYKLARQFNGEIINADSWQVRQEMNIGTAKPSTESMNAVPHHLIDILPPDGQFNTAIYKRLALDKIAEISKRKKLPILVGGTGLYIYSVIYNYSFLPIVDSKERQSLNELSLDELINLAKAMLLDTTSVDIRNKRRLVRLIEAKGLTPKRESLRTNTLLIGLHVESIVLKENIINRVDLMFDKGLEKEAFRLSQKYGWGSEGLKGIGYHEWQLYFTDKQSLAVTRERIIKDTWQLARRQQTWYRNNKSIQWITTPVNYTEIAAKVATFIE